MKTRSFLSLLTGILLATGLLLPSSASAQAYRSQLHFLEEFAVRQYDLGDMANANKEFQRILRIQPGNAVAVEYLKKIAAQPNTPAATKASIDEVITDISNIKSQLTDYEKDAKDLEYMIRNLITENDALYQALYKRSREVVELREKFYGTPYGDIYEQAMKDIPIDRVPQRLHPSNDILPDTDAQASGAYAEGSFATAINTGDVNGLIADITALARQNKPLNTPTSQSAELREALESKREALIDTAAATAEKQQNLERIKNELTTINTGLKQGVDRYIEAINKIDNYYRTIKEEIAKKNFNEQKLFSDLVADYADKVKELEELKRATPGRSKGLTAYKPTLAAENARINDLLKNLAIRDKQLAGLKSLLVQYKQELSDRDAIIHLQQGDLNLTDKKITNIQEQVSAIEKNLSDSGKTLTELNESIDQAKQQGLARAAATNDMQVKEVEAKNADLAARIDLHEKALGKSGQHIRNLERQLASVTSDLNRAIVTKESTIEQPLIDKINLLTAEMATRNSKIQELQTFVDDEPVRQAQLRDELKKTQADLAALQQRTQTESSALQKTIADQKSEIDASYQKLDEASKKIQELERIGNIKEQRVTELSESFAQLQQDQRTLHPANGTRAVDDDMIDDLKMRLRRSQDMLSDAEQTATRASTTIADLNDKIAARDIQIEQLKLLSSVNQGEELKALKRQLSDQDASLTELTHQNRALKEQLEKSLTASPGTASIPAVGTSDSKITQALTLSLKEKEQRITDLEKMLITHEKALKAAQDKVTAKDQISAITDIKQEAAGNVLFERDQAISKLATEVKALKQEVTALQLSQKELKAKRDDAISAQMLAEGKLQANENEIAALQVKIKDLRSDIKTASELMDKKARDNDATLAEIKRLNDVIEKKNNEIADLQLRIKR
jgi:chromosome segregation ATPase